MKTRRVEIAPEAEADMDAIYDWVAEQAGHSVAINYLDALERFCQSLEVASERGSRRDDVRENLRILGFRRRVTIAFVVEDTRVVILRSFYGGQNWENIMRSGG